MSTPTSLADAASALSERVLTLIDSGVSTPIVLIDGRAGSGKSTLAALLQNDLFREGDSLPRLIHMDDLYEGWDGLQAGVDYLQRLILNPIASKRKAEWQEVDWSKNERGRWREFEGGTPLIIEGCGSISRLAAEAASIKIWVEADDQTRYQRWIEREGNDEFFGKWAAQEVEFYSRERSSELADLTVTN